MAAISLETNLMIQGNSDKQWRNPLPETGLPSQMTRCWQVDKALRLSLIWAKSEKMEKRKIEDPWTWTYEQFKMLKKNSDLNFILIFWKFQLYYVVLKYVS